MERANAKEVAKQYRVVILEYFLVLFITTTQIDTLR